MVTFTPPDPALVFPLPPAPEILQLEVGLLQRWVLEALLPQVNNSPFSRPWISVGQLPVPFQCRMIVYGDVPDQVLTMLVLTLVFASLTNVVCLYACL